MTGTEVRYGLIPVGIPEAVAPIAYVCAENNNNALQKL